MGGKKRKIWIIYVRQRRTYENILGGINFQLPVYIKPNTAKIPLVLIFTGGSANPLTPSPLLNLLLAWGVLIKDIVCTKWLRQYLLYDTYLLFAICFNVFCHKNTLYLVSKQKGIRKMNICSWFSQKKKKNKKWEVEINYAQNVAFA